MFHIFSKLASAVTNAATNKFRFYSGTGGRWSSKDSTGAIREYAYLTEAGGSGGASVPNYSADVTVGRTIVNGDLQNLIVFNSASNATFTIPNDATLGTSGVINNYIAFYHKGNGVANIAAGAGVTITTAAGSATPSIGVTTTLHRVGVSTWAYL